MHQAQIRSLSTTMIQRLLMIRVIIKKRWFMVQIRMAT